MRNKKSVLKTSRLSSGSFRVVANKLIYALQNFAPMTFNDLLAKIESNYIAGAISDEQLVQIIELVNGYLNLKTVTNKSKSIGKSYNGVKMHLKPDVNINGIKFYIDNE